MGLLSKFEGKMEDTVEGAADRMTSSPLSPVQIAKKAEKQMRREKMVGAGKQYAPTLYTVLVSESDDQRLTSYYPTLAGETQTYLAAKAVEHGLVMDGQPLVRFIVDDGLKSGKFEVVAEMVAAPLVEQLRQEEFARYGLQNQGYGVRGYSAPAGMGAGAGAGAAGAGFVAGAGAATGAAAGANFANSNYNDNPHTMVFDPQGENDAYPQDYESDEPRQAYLYDITNDRAFTLSGSTETIGRESRNSIVIPDINVSRSHAEIRQDESGAWIITDLGSTNGTFVNGRQIKSSPLYDADRIIIGTTNIEFQLI